MAKGKGRRGDRHPEAPESPAATHRPAGAAVWHDLIAGLLTLLALAATLFIWLYEPLTAATQLKLTLIVWIVAVVGLLGRLHARRTVLRLRATMAHDEIMLARLAPDITEGQSGLRMRHVSAWLVAVLGIVASAVLWQTDAIERGVGGMSPFIVGSAVSVMFALAVAANAVNRLKTKRLTRDFRTALNSERLALGTLAGVDVMLSACLPTGERTRFNERFLQFLGKTAEQLQGHGWLEMVQTDDRQCALELLAQPASSRQNAREHDMCVRRANGDLAWLRETLTPRFDEKGELIEFVCSAINITSHVETETALDKQVGALTTELADVKTELSKTKTSRNRFEKSREEARADVKNLQEALTKAEAGLTKTQSETVARIKEIESEAKSRVKSAEEAAESRARKAEQASEGRIEKLEESAKSARQELQQASSENKKLTRSFEKLQDELEELRQKDVDLRAQIVRHIKETREAKAEVTYAHTREAQNRAKSDRLAQRCEELEKQFAARAAELAAAQNQAQQAGVTAMAEVERRMHEVSAEALARQLRKQLNGMQRMTSELLATSLAGPVRDAAHNTAASLRAMSDLVDQALSGSGTKAAAPSAKPITRSASAAASFDLRRTAQGVRELLVDEAHARGVKLEVEIASKLPALVHGDDIEIRTALLSLTDAASHLAEDGTLILRLSEDVSTVAHSTIRCELRHATARVKNETLEGTLAIKSTDNDMPDATVLPLAHQAAKAWRTVRSLQGQHGYLLPDEGGFSVWFTLILERPGAAPAAPSAPEPAESPASAGAPGPASASAAAPPSAPAPTSAPSAASASAPTTPRSLRAALAAISGTELEAGVRKGSPIRPATSAAPAEANSSSAAAPPPAAPAPAAPVASAPVAAAATAAPPHAQADAAAPRQPLNMPRMPQELLTCNLGEVAELGADSIRVFCAKPPKHKDVTITFEEVETDMKIRAEVSWSKKIAGRKHDVGLKFIGVTPAEQKRILRIAMQHRRVATMLDDTDEAR